MKTKKLLLMLCLVCTSTAFSQKMYLTRAYSPFTEVKYTYGENDRVIEMEDRASYTLKSKFTYNDLNQCIREDNYQLMDDDEWLHASYLVYTYDENGNLATRINYNLDLFSHELVKTGLMAYEYDDKHHLIVENTGLFMGEEKDKVVPYMRRTFTYDENGKKKTVLYEENEEMWGDEDPVWNESIKGVYHYNDLGKLDIDSSFTVSYETGEWVYCDKNTYAYDKNGNITLHEYYYGAADGTRWSISSFDEYEYDPTTSAAEYVYPINHEIVWPKFDNIVNKRVKEISHQKDDDGIMQLYDTYIYEYSPTGTSSIETAQVSDSGKMLIYPNPVKESFTLKLEDKRMPVYIYDAEGRLKVSFSDAEGTLNVSELPTGIYFVKCGKYTTKLVKE